MFESFTKKLVVNLHLHKTFYVNLKLLLNCKFFLGGGHKIKNGNCSEGQKDIEKISRKGTAACNSINIKLNKIEKDMKILQENRKLQVENRAYKNCKMELTRLRKEKTAIETDLNKSQTLISNFFLTVLMTTLSYKESVTTFF